MKKTMGLGFLASAAVVASALSTPASATVWDFYALAGGTPHVLGSAFTFTQGSQTVLAEAVTPGSPGVWYPATLKAPCKKPPATKAKPCLFAKGPSPSAERGLGLIPNADKEVFYHDGIEIIPSGHLTDILLGSVQHGESWEIEGCHLTGPCAVLAHGIGGTTPFVDVKSPSFANYQSFVVDVPCPNKVACLGGKTNSDNNIVLASITTVTGVPEPATLSLLALGLAGLGFARRRRKSG